MNKPIHNFFANDHKRIDSILEKAIENPEAIDMHLYKQFRIELLTHIKMEEKILFLSAQRANNNQPLPIAKQLRLEHGAITALMVPSPNKDLIKVLLQVFEKNDLEVEETGGMYDMCENVFKEQISTGLQGVAAGTKVPVQPHNDAPIALESAKRALKRAGFDYDEIVDLK